MATLFRFSLLATCLAASTSSYAQGIQSYPDKPITIVVPFTPGTGIDVLARTLGQKMSQRMGQAVIVDNKPGASGNIGTGIVAHAPADGYTLLMTVSTFVMNPGLFKQVPYDPITSFAPVAQTATGAQVFVVHPSFPAQNMTEAVALLKANPGKYTYASPGNGTPPHMAMELLKLNTGTDVMHVPYKGSAGAITDLLAGHINMMMLPINAALAHVKTGKVRILGVARAQRLAVTPDVPTLAEQGLPDIDVDLWFGLLAPAGTSPVVVDKINGEIKKILALPDVREALGKQGLVPAPGAPQVLAKLIQDDAARWADVVKKARITAD